MHNVSSVHLIYWFDISSRHVDFRDFKSFTDSFNSTASKVTGLKLENCYFITFTFSWPEVWKVFFIYVFTFSFFWPEVGKVFLIYFFLLFLDLKLENYSLFTFLLFLDLKLENYSVFTFLSTWILKIIPYFDGLVQDCSNSSELAMELLQSCTKPTNYCFFTFSRPIFFPFFSTWSWKIIPYLRFYFFSTWIWEIIPYFGGLVQDYSNSSELAMEVLQSCTQPSIYFFFYFFSTYFFTFSRPEVGKLFRIYVFTFSRPEDGKLFHISMA